MTWLLYDSPVENFRTPTGIKIHAGQVGPARADGSVVLHSACGMGAKNDARDADWTDEPVTCGTCLLAMGLLRRVVVVR